MVPRTVLLWSNPKMTLQKGVRSKSAQDLRHFKVIACNLTTNIFTAFLNCRNASTSSEGRPYSPSPRWLTGAKLAAVLIIRALPPQSITLTLIINTSSQNVTHCLENTNRQPSTGGRKCSSPAPWSLRSLSGGSRRSGAGLQSSLTHSWRRWSPPCSRYSAPPSFTSSPRSFQNIIQAWFYTHIES